MDIKHIARTLSISVGRACGSQNFRCTTTLFHFHPSRTAVLFENFCCAGRTGRQCNAEPPGFSSLFLHFIFLYSTSPQIYHLALFSAPEHGISVGSVRRGGVALKKEGKERRKGKITGLKIVSHVNAGKKKKGAEDN